jgi:hypothetical protein
MLLAAAWLGPTPSYCQTKAAAPVHNDAYFLAIDHSSSMLEKGESGRPKWREMQDHAAQLLAEVPLHSEIHAATFAVELSASRSLPFDTEADRAHAIETVARMCESPAGNTRLFDSLGTIFTRAEQVFHGDPQREVRVLVFTDGMDNLSVEWSQASLQQRFQETLKEHPNVWLFFTPLAGSRMRVKQLINHPHAVEHAFKPPILLKVQPDKLVMNDPLTGPEQMLSLEFSDVSPEHWRLLQGTTVECEFQDADHRLTAVVEPLRLHPGVMTSKIRFVNSERLQPGDARVGVLKLTFPKLPQHEIRAGNLVDVEFASQGPPSISALTKPPYRWQRPIDFRLENADGASRIEWLVDGQPLPDAPTTSTNHIPVTFPHIGSRHVEARIHWPNGSVSRVERQVEIEPDKIDARVRAELISPSFVKYFLGGRYRLLDESVGDIAERRWYLNDVPLATSPQTVWLSSRKPSRIRLVATAPARAGERPEVRETTLEIPAISSAIWFPFWLGCLVLAVVGLRGLPFFFARRPREYRLYYSHRAVPAPTSTQANIDIGKYWRNGRRRAVIPLGELFPESAYWHQGAGAGECLQVYLSAKGADADGRFDYTGADSRFSIGSPPFRDDHPGLCFRLTDQRCTDEPFRTLYFRLTKGRLRRSIPRMATFGLLVLLGLAVGLVWSMY